MPAEGHVADCDTGQYAGWILSSRIAMKISNRLNEEQARILAGALGSIGVLHTADQEDSVENIKFLFRLQGDRAQRIPIMHKLPRPPIAARPALV